MTEIKTDNHTVEKGNICPNCGAKDAIIFHEKETKQTTLTGESADVYKKLKRPYCEKCGKDFSKGTYFHKAR